MLNPRIFVQGAMKYILVIVLVNSFMSHQEATAKESDGVDAGVVIIWPKASKSAAAGV
jgi:hypothetical protein